MAEDGATSGPPHPTGACLVRVSSCPDEMPWREFGRMDDVTLTAVHAYLDSLWE